MFGIGFLLILVVALTAIHFLTLMFPAKARPYLWLALVVLAVSFPFWHYLYPSYREFMALCERSDRSVLLKTVEVDYAYSDGGSFSAYRQHAGLGFKGYEIKQGRLGYFRYTQNENWAAATCQRDCASPSVFVWEKTCEVTCLTKTAIPAPEFEYTSNFATTELVPGRLVQHKRSMLAPSGEELSVNRNYVYFPYGRGWATVLGGSSGDPPTLSCRSNRNIETREFLKPKTGK